MPLDYARRLTGRERTAEGNARLGYVLAFVAGATDAGGFLAVHQDTSRMTGIVSAMADHLVLGSYDVVLAGLGGLLCFLLGAMTSAAMVNFARRRRLSIEYALPLLLEAVLLIGFGGAGASLQRFEGLFVPATVMLLCFLLDLQNAVVSKLSRAEIRTTHITGTLTDIGIELGKLSYWSRTAREGGKVLSNRRRLASVPGAGRRGRRTARDRSASRARERAPLADQLFRERPEHTGQPEALAGRVRHGLLVRGHPGLRISRRAASAPGTSTSPPRPSRCAAPSSSPGQKKPRRSGAR